MISLKIDDKKIEIENGKTILDAAKSIGIDIPTMCHYEGLEPFTSCLVCVVKDRKTGKLMPSCAIKVVDGMELESNSEEVHEARKTALELLLSEHLGDCEAPCQKICPAHMDIPNMIRLIENGEDRKAIELIKETIALPAILGRICPAPCEKGCRRKQDDSPVSICYLKGFAAEADLRSKDNYVPQCKNGNDKSIGIIGSGPGGLSAAYYLLQKGYRVTCYEKSAIPGGDLHKAVEEGRLPTDVLQAEIAVIEKMGLKFKCATEIGTDLTFDELQRMHDSIIIASGKMIPKKVKELYGFESEKTGLKIDKNNFKTELENVYAIGGLIAPGKLAIRSCAHGLQVADIIDNNLMGTALKESNSVNVAIGKVEKEEMVQFKQSISDANRVVPEENKNYFTVYEARAEAKRCLRCDCAKPKTCKLRIYGHEYGALVKGYRNPDRELFRRIDQHESVIYEPGKCVNCGICVRLTEKADAKYGMAFIGRGYEVDVKVPFAELLKDGLGTVAKECVENCPTGALYFK